MSICKKGRRKIVCGDKHYIWYVSLGDDSPYYVLSVASDDKRLIISCPLGMNIPYIIVHGGKYFQGEKVDGFWHRRLIPFAVPEIITPGFVAKLIDWAEHAEPTEEIKWDWNNGNGISEEYIKFRTMFPL